MKLVAVLGALTLARSIQSGVPPCGNSTFRAEINTTMESAITDVNSALIEFSGNCPPTGFDCVAYDSDQILTLLSKAINKFLQVMDSYSDYLQEPFSPFCALDRPVCDCSTIYGQFDTLFVTYNTSYAEDWSQFIGSSGGDCNQLASELRGWVASLYCQTEAIANNLITCRRNCRERCFDISDRFPTRIELIMGDAGRSFRAFNVSMASQCQRSNILCSVIPNNADTLENMRALYQEALDAYNEYLNDPDYESICPIRVASCSCTEIMGLLDSLENSQSVQYRDLFLDVELGIVADCQESLVALRDIVNSLLCDTKALISAYEQCKINCEECNVPVLVCDEGLRLNSTPNASPLGFLGQILNEVIGGPQQG